MTIEETIRDAVRQAVRESLPEALREALPELRQKPAGAGEYLTVKQAGELAGVHVNTIRSWLKAGAFPRHWAGRELRVRRDELERFMETGTKPEGDQATVEERALAIMQGRRCK